MEAPETIFVNNLGYGCLSEPCTERMFASQIEYVRKDVFINRIHELLSNRINDIIYYHDKTEFINDFLNDIKEDIE